MPCYWSPNGYPPCRPSNKYPLPLNRIPQSNVSLRSGSESKNFKAIFVHVSTLTLTNCKLFFFLLRYTSNCFISFIPDPSHPIKPAQISAACVVADVLGPDVRTHYIARYVALELKEYRRIFRATDEAGGLDNISRRFAWFRRLLTGHETEAGRVFPVEWKVDWELFAKFAEITRLVN